MMRASRLKLSLCLGISVVFGLSACAKKEETPHADKAHAQATLHHWSYSGDEGPAFWANLGGVNTICKSGTRQSPIDVSGNKRAESAKIVFDYQTSATTIQNNGHTVVVTPSHGGGVVLDGVVYKLKQFHFHTPSEHAIDGHRSALETHFVHQNDKGEFLVIGVMSEVGMADPMMASVWTYLPTEIGGVQTMPDVLINARDFMPATEEFYAYSGSLTTPPCSEGVTWMIFNAPLSVSPEQIDSLSRIIGPSARPLQDRHERDLLNVN